MIPGLALVATVGWLLIVVLLATIVIFPEDFSEEEPEWHAEADRELKEQEGREL